MYVRVHIYTAVRERDIVPAMVRYAMVNTLSVIVRQIILGVEVLVYVAVISNIVVAVRDIVGEVEHHVVECISLVSVQAAMNGAEIPV